MPEKMQTAYHVMELQGRFKTNPANRDSRDENGMSLYKPQILPCLVYHPTGEERVTIPAEEIVTAFGPKRVGQKSEMIFREVLTQRALDAALADGWHLSPIAAIVAGNVEREADGRPLLPVPPQSPEIAAVQAAASELQKAASREDKLRKLLADQGLSEDEIAEYLAD